MFDAEAEVMADGSRGPYRLSARAIVDGSERIRLGDRPVSRGGDYRMDYPAAEVIFERGVPRGTPIRATFRVVPELLRPVYRHRLPADSDTLAAPGAEAKPFPSPPDLSPPSGYPSAGVPPVSTDLSVGGSKTFRVSVGSDRDAALDQSLRLNLSGRLGGGVEILGILSDRNLPIQPDGSTRSLSQLDQVLLQVRSPRLSAGLGDLDVNLAETEFARYERRIQGVSGEASVGSGKLSAFGASARGAYFSREIPAMEGSQGPYEVGGAGGRILAGSERVFLDGERMTRGLTEDYTVDYDAGTLTFTPRRPISADSRILVEAQSADGAYGRRIAGGRGRLGFWGDRVLVGATAIRESDAPDLAPATPFSPVNPAGLPKSPVSGQEGTGDSLTASPERRQLLGVDLSAAPTANLSVTGELAASARETGIASPGGRPGVRGLAVRGAVDLKPVGIGPSVRSLGTLALSGRIRSVSGRFSPMGRTRGVEEARSWGVRSDVAGERSAEVEGTYRLNFGSGVRLNYGRGRWGEEVSTRRGISVFGAARRLPGLAWEYESVGQRSGKGTGGRRIRNRAVLEGPPARIRPSLRYEFEQAEGSVARNLAPGAGAGPDLHGGGSGSYPSPAAAGPVSDWRYRELSGGLGAAEESFGRRGFTWSSRWTVRRTESRRGTAWSDSASTSAQRLRMSLSGGRALSASADYTHRRGRIGTGAPGSASDHLGEGRLSWTPAGGAVSQDLFYRLTSARIEGRVRRFLEVGRGHGTYTWVDLNGDLRQEEEEFLPDPDGDYALYSERTGLGEPAREASVGARFAFDPSRWTGRTGASASSRHPVRRLLSALSVETSLDADRSVRRGSADGIAPWALGSFSSGPGVVSARRGFQGDAYLFRSGRGLSVRARYRRDDSIGREYGPGELRGSTERSIRLRLRLRPDLDAEMELAGRDRSADGVGPGYRLGSSEARTRLVWRAGALRAVLNLAGGRDRDRRSGRSSSFCGAGAEVTRSFLGSGRLRGATDWTRTAAGADFPLYLALTQGRRPGDAVTWELGADFQMGRAVTATCNYTGRRTPGLPVLHLGQAEVQASF